MKPTEAKKAAEKEINNLLKREGFGFRGIRYFIDDYRGLIIQFQREVRSQMEITPKRLKDIGKAELEAHIAETYHKFMRG